MSNFEDDFFNLEDCVEYSEQHYSNKMFNKLFDESIKPIAKTEVLENTKKCTKDKIETLLDGAIKIILSGDEVL